MARSSLEEALRLEDPEASVEAIIALTTRIDIFAASPLSDHPELPRMCIVLRALWLNVSVDGIWKFLSESDLGAYVPAAKAWCRAIGAMRSAEYLDEVERAFPGGSVPVDDRERDAILMDWDARGSMDPLRVIDRRYAGAVDELLPRLQEYLIAHRERLEKLVAERCAREIDADPAEILDPVDRVAMLAQLAELHSAPRPESVGELYELSTARGLVYLQVTHRHQLEPAIGPVVRVLKGFFARRPTDVRSLGALDTAFFTVYSVDDAIVAGELRHVAVMPVAPMSFPFFRHWIGRRRDSREVWGLWNGGLTTIEAIVGPLTPEQRALPVLDACSHDELVDLLERGLRPGDESLA